MKATKEKHEKAKKKKHTKDCKNIPKTHTQKEIQIWKLFVIPLWKISVKLDHFPRGGTKYIWNHHLD